MPVLELHLLRLLHVLGGIFWVGSALFTSLFLVPALAGSGADVGLVMGALRRRRLMTVLPLVALLTIASGVRLLWIASGGGMAGYLARPAGRTFAAAGAVAIAAFLVSLLVARPAAARAARLGSALAQAEGGAERAALAATLAAVRRRGAVASAAVPTLLVLSAAGMAVARYLG